MPAYQPENQTTKKMKAKKTEATFIIDRSGSMGSKIEQVVSGFNAFINQQKELDGECSITFTQFDNVYEVVYANKNINDVELMTQADFQPRGMTALYDAIGKTINVLGERYNQMQESERPDNGVLGIITDGFENASVEYTKIMIKEMIKHQEEKYNWNIIFLSEDLQASEDSKGYMRGANTMNVNTIADGMRMMSGYVSYSRSVDTKATLQDSEKYHSDKEKEL